MPRRTYRTDGNHIEIVRAFESLGCSVADLSGAPGDSVRNIGLPDLLVGIVGVNVLVEVKHGDNDLQADQREFINRWRGGQPFTVRNLADVTHVVCTVRAVVARKGAP